MEFSSLFEHADIIKNFLSDAAMSEFNRTLAIFAAAAYVHAQQVRKEIRAVIGELAQALRDDLDAQKKMLGVHDFRLDSIETKIKGEARWK